jgi:hypothetical protein
VETAAPKFPLGLLVPQFGHLPRLGNGLPRGKPAKEEWPASASASSFSDDLVWV